MKRSHPQLAEDKIHTDVCIAVKLFRPKMLVSLVSPGIMGIDSFKKQISDLSSYDN